MRAAGIGTKEPAEMPASTACVPGISHRSATKMAALSAISITSALPSNHVTTAATARETASSPSHTVRYARSTLDQRKNDFQFC